MYKQETSTSAISAQSVPGLTYDYEQTKMDARHTLGLAIQSYISGNYDGARNLLRSTEQIYNLAVVEADPDKKFKTENRASDIVKIILNHKNNIHTMQQVEQNGRLQEGIHTILNQ